MIFLSTGLMSDSHRSLHTGSKVLESGRAVPCGSVKWNSTYVVHVTMCNEYVGLPHSTVWAPSDVKGNLDLRQDHARLLHHPKSAINNTKFPNE